MSRYSEIMVVGKQKYPHLRFDIGQLSEVDICYDRYRIPTEETMVVYADSEAGPPVSRDMRGTLITDMAIYFHPSHREWGEDNRIPLSEICSFLIFQENSNDTVHLISESRDQSIFGRTVTPMDTTGQELVELLWMLQQSLMRLSSQDRRAYIDTLSFVFGYVKKGFHQNGMLDARSEKLLDIISWENEFLPEIVLLRAENEYRRMDEASYYRYISEQTGLVSEGLVGKLKRPDEMFFESFITDISNSASIFMTRSLLDAYTNLKKTERLTLKQAIILCFLCTRLEDTEYFEELLTAVTSQIPEDYIWRIESFRARFANEKMFPIYEKLVGNKVPMATELGITDAIGLTPLHYALILRNPELVRALLRSKRFEFSPSPFPKDRLVDLMYQYFFLAAILYDDMELIEEVLLYTTPLAKSLQRSIKRMDDFIFIQQSFIDRHEEKLSELLTERKSVGDSNPIKAQPNTPAARKKAEKRGSLEDAIHSENMAIASCREKIEEYETMKREMHSELRTMVVEQAEDARKKASIIVDTEHPFCKFLFDIYMEADELYRVMADTISTWQVLRYKDLYFAASTEQQISLEHRIFPEEGDFDFISDDYVVNPAYRAAEEKRKRDEERRRAEQARQRTSYDADGRIDTDAPVEGWFSQDARSDIAILKKEYRGLVKKYHPDVSKDAHTARILQSIMRERADILESM